MIVQPCIQSLHVAHAVALDQLVRGTGHFRCNRVFNCKCCSRRAAVVAVVDGSKGDCHRTCRSAVLAQTFEIIAPLKIAAVVRS